MTTPQFEDRVIEALESLLKAFNSLLPGAKHIAIQDYALLNDGPMNARRLVADLKQQSADRPRVWVCLAACEGVPDDLLKPGMVKEFIDLHPDLANYLETCTETFRHDFDDASGSLLIRLNEILPERPHAEPPSES